MSTPYETIDNIFLGKVTDNFLLTLTEPEVQKILDGYRTSANVTFKKCNKLSDRDEVLRQYNQTLTDEEIEILSNIMVLEWLKPKINSMENIKQGMSTKDFKIYSQANHLEKLIELKNSTKFDVDRMITSYTYSSNSLENLKKV